jgi:formamidopyrimidine-DNA glycosylase
VPELPEVETIARGLDPVLRGRVIDDVVVRWARTVDPRSKPLASLAGRTIVSVGRIGKFVAIRVDDGTTITVHLRMTGRLTVVGGDAAAPHERLRVRFRDGARLAFADARKFGRVRAIDGGDESALGVGIDALHAGLDDATFARLLAGRKTPIKTLLLDQRRLAGVGNIYANEALFGAGVRPTRRAGRLTAAQRKKLLRALRRVLERAIASRGSSVDDYVDAEGLPGSFQKLLKVYGRAGLPCRRCRTPIKRVVLAQRGTFYCPACQR